MGRLPTPRPGTLFNESNHLVAVALLTQRDVDLLGATFERLWPVEDASCFADLLRAIDEADRVEDAVKPEDV